MDDRAHGRCLLPVLLELLAGNTMQNEADDVPGLEVLRSLGNQAGGSIWNLVAAEDHLALVGEVPEKGSRRQTGPGGDLRNGRRLKPLLGEQLDRCSLKSSTCIRSPSHGTSLVMTRRGMGAMMTRHVIK